MVYTEICGAEGEFNSNSNSSQPLYPENFKIQSFSINNFSYFLKYFLTIKCLT